MNHTKKKLVIIQAAALGYSLLQKHNLTKWTGLTFRPMETVFPAVTCTAQASFKTASAPAEHGMIGNGLFLRDIMRPLFWEQSSKLVSGTRIWDKFRENGGTVGMFFWQQSLGESVDAVLSPAPVHKHHGGIVQSCYSQPADLYDKVCASIGRPFNLMHYWGPIASVKSSDWIASATSTILLDKKIAPDLCLTYLPALDYDLQRYGPDSPRAGKAVRALFRELNKIITVATSSGYEVVIFGDYAISEVKGGAILPNRALLDANLFVCRDVEGALYPDFNTSKAFAMVDHEIAHVYINDPKAMELTANLLRELPGIEKVLDKQEQKALGIAHNRSGDLMLIAENGHWFAYPWWKDNSTAPDYAKHVDIHNKPGYDPCELFFGWPPMTISRNLNRIKGSHGKIGGTRQACWASTCQLDTEPTTLLELASSIRNWLEPSPSPSL
ncbi:MAG: alkaline phosphatase family protein [Kiritimatiellae bacterium]|nr:alkaline phosphatase family protein [Kiritimatiellia bacterium]